MKRKIFSILFALALVCSFSLVAAVPAAAADTIIVGPNPYTSIQMAINAANDGDTIIVEAATYYETIDVTKDNLTIQSVSDDPSDTIIDGSGFADNVVTITGCSGVTFSGFTITGDKSSAGIYMEGASGCSISDVVITEMGGIHLIGSSGNTFNSVEVSEIAGYQVEYGMKIGDGSNSNTFQSTTISDITVSSAGAKGPAGIWIARSDNNEFVDTKVTGITGESRVNGIFVHFAAGNTFTSTKISDIAGGTKVYGISLMEDTGTQGVVEFSDYDISNITTTSTEPNKHSHGIYLFKSPDYDFSGGSLTGADFGVSVGVDSSKYIGPGPCGSIHNTNIVGNTLLGVQNYSWGGDVAFDATNNWWGSPSGPTHALNTYTAPTGDPQGNAVSDLVDFVPWLDGPYPEGKSFAPVTLDDTGQFSSIQAAVNAAKHTTILLLPGTYTEDVLVDVAGITIKGVSLDAIVDGGFILKANNITIDGLTIKNGCNNRAIFTQAATGPTWGSKGHRIINNELIGPGDTTGYGINIVACAAEPVNILVDNNRIHGWRIAIMLEGYNTTIINNELYDNSKSGIEVERSCDNRISRNNIHGNGQRGIYIGKVVTTGNAINFNNIWANGEYGVLINPENPGTVNALFNWWDDVTGPEQATTNPDGKGNKVSDNVDYIPWLTRHFQTVLTEGIGYYGFPMVELGTGWNLLSTPFALDPGETIGGVTYPGCNTWAQFVTLNDLPLYTGADPEYVNAYYYDGEDQDWGEVTGDYVLLPCDAIYVRMASPDIAAVLASPQRWMPTKTLYEDWNLVGLSWMPTSEQGTLHAKLALKSVEEVGSLTGYTQVVSPWTNQQPWTYIAGMDITPGPGWMLLTKGYWVFMENGPDVLAGSWPTPMGLP